jgi:hypothetical protein
MPWEIDETKELKAELLSEQPFDIQRRNQRRANRKVRKKLQLILKYWVQSCCSSSDKEGD